MPPIKVRKLGNSLGIILTTDILARLGVKEGDSLSSVASADHSITLSPYNEEFAAQMAAAEGIMHKRRNVLRELSKK